MVRIRMIAAVRLVLGFAILFPTLAVSAGVAASDATGTISGLVTDAQTGAPVLNIDVVVYGQDGSAYTDSSATMDGGIYEIPMLPPGTYKIQFISRQNTYVDEWWEDVPDRESSTVITVGDSSDAVRIDASMTPIDHPTMVIRIAGADRYETAAELHQFVRPDPYSPEAGMFMATGEAYPDALVAGTVSGRYGGPILLTRRNDIPSATRDDLLRVRPFNIIIIGGPNAVSPVVETQLDDLGIYVERIYGTDRYATAAAVCEVERFTGTNRVYVTTGESFPDALAAVPSAVRSQAPILLTRSGSLPAETRDQINRLSPEEIVVIGGPDAVSDGVVAELERLVTTVTRIGGSDRYATASAVAIAAMDERLHPGTWVYIVSGENFPDALATGPIAGHRTEVAENGPILLTRRDSLPAATRSALEEIGPDVIIIVGGTAVISEDVERQLLGTDW